MTMTLPDLVAREVELNYVGPMELARYYGVPIYQIRNAVGSGRLRPIVVLPNGGGKERDSRILLFDRRTIPITFPHKKAKQRKRKEAVRNGANRRGRFSGGAVG